MAEFFSITGENIREENFVAGMFLENFGFSVETSSLVVNRSVAPLLELGGYLLQ